MESILQYAGTALGTKWVTFLRVDPSLNQVLNGPKFLYPSLEEKPFSSKAEDKQKLERAEELQREEGRGEMGRSEKQAEAAAAAAAASVDLSREEIEYVSYGGEHHLPLIMRLVDQELSEPYSIFTYRYFVYLWPQLSFLVCISFSLLPYMYSSHPPRWCSSSSPLFCCFLFVNPGIPQG